MFKAAAEWFSSSRPASRWGRTLTVSALVGLLAGIGAAALEAGLHYGTEGIIGRFAEVGGATTLRFSLPVLLLPSVGALTAGLILLRGLKIRHEHGVDAYTRAFHRNGGALPLKGPLARAAGAVGVISCGGSAGPEGPIAALGAAIGSTVADRLRLTVKERRVFLVAGCAAGVGAIFRCPLGGALFAANVLYREPEFEHRALVPALIASVVSYSTFMGFWGFGSVLLPGTQALVFSQPLELIPYLTLAVTVGIVSIFFCTVLRAVEKLNFAKIGVPSWAAPAIGGLAVGALACLLPQVMDGRYVLVREALGGRLFTGNIYATGYWLQWAAFFGIVALAKCVATALTVGTGAPGGVLGPSIFIGAVTGAAVGAAFEALMPGAFPEDLRRALIPVGMAGILSAGLRVPLPAIVMITEMTGGYGLIVPLMLVCAVSYVIGRRWGLNTEQVRSTAQSPAHAGDALVHMLETTSVHRLMQSDWPDVARRDTPLSELVGAIRAGTYPLIAVLDDGRIIGVISGSDIRRVGPDGLLDDAAVAADVMTRNPVTVQPDYDVYTAMSLIRKGNFEAMPVVDGRQRFLGMITRAAIRDALDRHQQELRRRLLAEHADLAGLVESDDSASSLLGTLPPRQRGTVLRMSVPPEVVGQSLRTSEFRTRYSAEVFAIRGADGATHCPPDPNRPLRGDDVLIVLSSPSVSAAIH